MCRRSWPYLENPCRSVFPMLSQAVVVLSSLFASESKEIQFVDEYWSVGNLRGQGFGADFADSVFLNHRFENIDSTQAVRWQWEDCPSARMTIPWGPPNAYWIIHRDVKATILDDYSERNGRLDENESWD